MEVQWRIESSNSSQGTNLIKQKKEEPLQSGFFHDASDFTAQSFLSFTFFFLTEEDKNSE